MFLKHRVFGEQSHIISTGAIPNRCDARPTSRSIANVKGIVEKSSLRLTGGKIRIVRLFQIRSRRLSHHKQHDNPRRPRKEEASMKIQVRLSPFLPCENNPSPCPTTTISCGRKKLHSKNPFSPPMLFVKATQGKDYRNIKMLWMVSPALSTMPMRFLEGGSPMLPPSACPIFQT